MEALVRVVTQPAQEPITIAEVRSQAITDPDATDDDRINMLIADARMALDGPNGWLGRCLITQTLELTLDQFPERRIELPYPPLQAVTSITYTDVNGVDQVMDAADYRVIDASDNQKPYIVPAYGKCWPATRCEEGAVRVLYAAGYGDTEADVPQRIKQYMLMHAATKYELREEIVVGTTVAPLQFVERMLDNFRIR